MRKPSSALIKIHGVTLLVSVRASITHLWCKATQSSSLDQLWTNQEHLHEISKAWIESLQPRNGTRLPMTCFRRSGQQIRATRASTIPKSYNRLLGVIQRAVQLSDLLMDCWSTAPIVGQWGWKSNSWKGTDSPQETSSRQRSFAKFAQSPTWEEYRVRIDFDNLGGCQRHSWIILGSAQSERGIPWNPSTGSMHQGELVRFRPSRVFCSDPLQPPVHEIRRLVWRKTRYR